MLSAAPSLIEAAGAGLHALATGQAMATGLGLAGLAAAAGFLVLLGLLSEPPVEAAPVAAPAMDRRVALLCTAAFLAIGAVAGALAWATWRKLGGEQAIGLVALALAFVTAALVVGRARR